MGTNAGDLLDTDDFMLQLDAATADIAVLEGLVTSLQASIAVLFEREQSDGTVVSTDGLGQATILFPNGPFSTTPVVTVSPGNYDNGVFVVGVVACDETSFVVRCHNLAEVLVTGTDLLINWQASLT